MDITIEFFMKNCPMQTYYQPCTIENGHVNVRVSAYKETLRLEDGMTKTLAKFIPSPLLTEEITQVFLSYCLPVLESDGTQMPIHVHDHFRSYRVDNRSIWGSFA